MIKREFLPANRSGIAIDAIAIVGNLLLFPLLFSVVGNLFEESFTDNNPAFITLAGLMFFILAGRLVGLYLKRFPLQTRRAGSEGTTFPTYFFILNVGVFVLNCAFVAVLISTVAGQLGLIETDHGDRPKESLPLALANVFFMLLLMGAEIYLIYRLSLPLSARERALRAHGDWKFDGRGEFAADFGLFCYMMVWQVFYNNTAKLLMTPPPNTPDTWEYRIFSMVFLFIVFLIFYVSPRTVFLIEDRKHIGTWVFIIGVYLASVVRYW